MAVLSTQAFPQSVWLKAEAEENIPYMVVTRPTFHAERSSLKAEAKLNICRMLVTRLTFHVERSRLKAEAE